MMILMIIRLIPNTMQVSDAEIDQFAKEHGFAAWYRVSAKEGTQVKTNDDKCENSGESVKVLTCEIVFNVKGC